MKNQSNSFRLAAALVVTGAAFAFTGCASNVNSYERAESQAAPSYVADKRVITDNTLAGALRVTSINQATVSGNLLKIQATVENLRSSQRTFNYKFEWFDQDGMAVNSPNETWKSLPLQGRESTTISTVATSPRAVDFKLKFKE
ncbi:YcfL family protein [Oleiharenicola lentus]|uniref:YcfL family protein n=1 Tax=Oleiharenicola lentus TaxID=2508720 RepID=UPI003F67E38B